MGVDLICATFHSFKGLLREKLSVKVCVLRGHNLQDFLSSGLAFGLKVSKDIRNSLRDIEADVGDRVDSQGENVSSEKSVVLIFSYVLFKLVNQVQCLNAKHKPLVFDKLI